MGRDRRRSLHHHEAGLLKVLHEPIGRDPRHGLVCMLDRLAPVEPEPVRDSVQELFGWDRAEGWASAGMPP